LNTTNLFQVTIFLGRETHLLRSLFIYHLLLHLSLLPIYSCVISFFFTLLISVTFLFSQLRAPTEIFIVMYSLINTSHSLWHHKV